MFVVNYLHFSVLVRSTHSEISLNRNIEYNVDAGDKTEEKDNFGVAVSLMSL